MAERRHRAGVYAALMVLSRGTCYKPGCPVPTVVEVAPGLPVVNLEIAHICALKATGARYDELPDGLQRDSFTNLILLCHPHHLLIDKVAKDKYSADTLRAWKSEREKGRQAELSTLTNVTDEGLQDLIAEAIQDYHQQLS